MKWENIPGWFDWRDAQEECVSHFDGGVLIEVGCYLGRSLVSLAEIAKSSGKAFRIVGVEIGTGSGPEGESNQDNHWHAVNSGGGTIAGSLHRNLIECGVADIVDLIIAPSIRAATLIENASVSCVFLDASHDEWSVRSDISCWLPKVRPGGWIGGDDLSPVWPEVEKAVSATLPGWQRWSHDSWRYKVIG